MEAEEEEEGAGDRDLGIVDVQDPDPVHTNVVQGALQATVPWSARDRQVMTTRGQALVASAGGHPARTRVLVTETGMDHVAEQRRRSLGLAPGPKLDMA